MSQSYCSTIRSFRFVASLCILVLSFTCVIAQQTSESKRPALDLEGNKVFAKATLLDVVNSPLDAWAKNGGNYAPAMLDYSVHQLDMFMKSHGYLQAKATQGNIEQTEAGPRVLLTVSEGPLYRVGKMTVDGAQLLTAEQVLDEIGLKTGDIANGRKVSEGMFERLKNRYGNFGYVQYEAEITPTFHAEKDAAEGVVDLKLTIDEGKQFTVRSIKIDGADKTLTDVLRRELMLRAGDIFDNELFHESVTRMNRTGLVNPIDSERDVYFKDNQQKASTEPALLDLVIRVKKSSALAARQP
jgi:outer membrane protein insertion porin family